MQRVEIIKLVGICSLNYRNWPETGKEEALINLWESMLDDVDYEVGRVVIKKFISESVFPPTIADIRARIADVTVARGKTGIEAWGDVKLAIRRFGSYNEEKAMEFLKGPTRKVVESIGFRTLCLSENEMADRAHFLKVYDTVEKREREDALLLPEIRNAMTTIQNRSNLLLNSYEEDQGA